MRAHNPMRILIVDDEVEHGQALVGLLGRYGHEPEAVATGLEAIAWVENARPGYDIIFVDQFLYEGIDGLEVLRRLKTAHSDLPVVLFTGQGDVEAGIAALRLGAYRYIFKPINDLEIELIIQSVREIETLRREKEWLSNLLQISHAMLGTRQLDEVLQTIAEAAQRMLEFRLVVVSLVDDDCVRVHALAGLTEAEAAQLHGRTYSREVFFRPMQEQFLISQSYYIPAERYDWQAEYPAFFLQRDLGLRSADDWQSGDLLRVPIRSPQGNIVGIITVDDPADQRRPSFETIRALELLADQAALALENARLFAEERRRREIADTLSEVPKVINGVLKLDVVLDRILRELQRVVRYDSASVQLLNKAKTGLGITACHGFPSPESVRAIVFPLDPERHPNVVVWQRRQTLIVKDVRDVYPAFTEPGFAGARVRGWLGVPLLYGSHSIGVLSIDSWQVDVFQAEHAALALTFANQAAVAIANARLFEELQRRTLELEKLLAVGQTLAQKVTDPSEVLEIIAGGAAAVTGADCVVIYPYNHTTQSYDVRYIKYHGLHGQLIPRETPRRDGGLSASIIKKGRLIIEDVNTDDDVRKAKFIQREKIRAFIGMSLVVANNPVGVLFVNYRRPHIFTEDEQQTIAIFATQAAVAIHNSRLYYHVHQELAQQIRKLKDRDELNKAIIEIKSSLDLNTVLDRVLDQALAFTRAPYGSISLVDAPQKRYQTRVARPVRARSVDEWIDLPSSLVGYVVAEGSAQRINDISDVRWRDLHLLDFPEAKAALLVPLREGREVIGCLTVASFHPEIFSAADEAALSELTSEVVLAVLNARRYEQAQHEIESLEGLLRTGQLVTQSLQLETVLSAVISLAKTLLPEMDIITLYYYDEATRKYKLGGHEGVRRQILDAEEGEWSVVGRIMKMREPLIVPDVEREPILESRFIRLEEVVSVFAAPLIVSELPVGAMFVNYRSHHNFPQREKNLLNIFASYAATAIHHARQYEAIEKQQKQLEALQQASRAMASSLDTDHILKTILSHARDVTKAWLGTYQILEGRELLFVQTDPPDRLAELQSAPGRVSINQGITGRAARTCTAVLVSDVSQDGDYISPPGGQPHAELAIPILDNGLCLGVLNLEHEEVGAFSASDVELLTALSNDAVVAIRKAQLYRQAQQHAQMLLTLYNVGQRFIADLKLPRVLEAVVTGAAEVLVADVVSLFVRKRTGVNALLEPEDGAGADYYTGLVWEAQQVTAAKQEWYPRTSSLAAEVMRTQRLQVVPDVSCLPEAQNSAILREKGLRSFVCAPLLVREEVLGLLYVDYFRARSFTDEDVRMIELFVNQAALAVRNAQRYSELEKARDHIATSDTVAGMGLMSSEWGHEINQKTFSFEAYLQGLDTLAERLVVERPEDSRQLREGLAGFQSVVESIRNVGETNRPPGVVERPIYLDEELNRLIELWRKESPGIHLEFDLQCAGAAAYIEAPWFKIALEKVVKNALKAMHGQGRLIITSRRINDYLQVTLHDTGPGLPEYVRANFLKAEIHHPPGAEDKGRGRGMLIAKFVMQSHRGELDLVFSNETTGTQIQMILPVYGTVTAG